MKLFIKYSAREVLNGRKAALSRRRTHWSMDDFLKMDVFFALASTALILVTVLIAVLVTRVLRILKHVERITSEVSEEAKLLRSDIDGARMRIRKEGFKFSHLAQFVRNSVRRFARRITK